MSGTLRDAECTKRDRCQGEVLQGGPSQAVHHLLREGVIMILMLTISSAIVGAFAVDLMVGSSCLVTLIPLLSSAREFRIVHRFNVGCLNLEH